MDQEYGIAWAQGVHSDEHGHQIICESGADDLIEENNDIEEDEEYLVGEEIIPSTEIITISNSLDQIAAENLIYMAQDGSVANMGDLIEEQVDQVDNADYNEQQYFECTVTEEVITDDWVQQQGEDRVEVPVYQLGVNEQNEEVLVPLPTDEYTTSRPYPCDFCSRRFRKKTNLMNHMVAHKNVKPHTCNLCGARYIRKIDLMNHLKVHAQVPDQNIEYNNDDKSADEQDDLEEDSLLTTLKSEPVGKPRRRTGPILQRKVVKIESGGRRTAQKKLYNENVGTSSHYESIIPDHVTAIDSSKPFVCQVCGVAFSREKALNAHVALHGIGNALECETCNEVFWTVESLQQHQKIHEVDEESSGSEYEPDGDKTASDEDFDPKYGNYYCNVCGMSFHRPDLLKRHAKTHKKDYTSNKNDNTTESHCCNVCGNTFEEALDLLAHAEIHTRASIQKCTLCGESFTHDNEIRQHIVNVHGRELTSTTCRMCGKHCKDERTLMKHAWDHSKEKNHSCTKCGKTFHNKARLRRHMQSHRNKSVSCNVCGENFPDGRSLMNHRHSHSNLSGRQFPCRECGKTFGSRSSQQIHMRIHTGERPYGCRFCWKAFADGGTLRKHERIHTGEKPYACPVCPRAFNQRVVLREHIRSHHSQPDPNYEDSLMPYYCTVCGNLYKTSQEIIQHLIEHSDANTVSNRQPVVGPRKYKRRRKLKPEELETFRKSKNETTTTKTTSKRTSRKRDVSEQSDTNYSSSYEHQEDVIYESSRNDNDTDNIEVDEPEIQRIHSVGTRVKPESYDSDPLYTGEYLEETAPKRKSPTKRQTTVASQSSTSYYVPVAQSTKKKVVIETKGSRTTTKVKKVIASNQIKLTPPEIDNGGTRRSSRTKQPTNKKMESLPSPSKSMTNGTPRSKSQANALSNLYGELSLKKTTNLNPDVVSDLEGILGSPIKTTRETHRYEQVSISENVNAKNVDVKPHINDEIKPATRSSKRLSNRVQPTVELPLKAKTVRTAKKLSTATVAAYHADHISEYSQESQDDPFGNLQNNISEGVVIVKQEKEVSYTMTDDSTNLLVCEMCSAVFTDRELLLAHVRVHI